MKKLGRCEWPNGLQAKDFKAYGPPATHDTEFSTASIADMGCFMQEGVDSNKYYHCARVTDPSNNWYVYVEYGRVGATNPQFQFIVCDSEAESRRVFEAQCNEKNTSRGEWQTIGGTKLFRPRVGSNGKPKDLYVVRDLAKRDVGLPDARNIASPHFVAPSKPSTGKKNKTSYRCDPQTTKLMRDLMGGAITYTKAAIQGGTIPTQRAIDQGRELIQNVLARIAKVGDDVKDQIADKEIRDISYALYGLIPKKKPLHCPDEDWILSDYTSSTKRQSNIALWQEDLDAFEGALKSADVEEIAGDDPLDGMPLDMEWIDPKSDVGQYLLLWWPKATRGHHHYGSMKIKNLWKINRHGDEADFTKHQTRILKDLKTGYDGQHRALHQDKKRGDLNTDDRKKWWDSNSALVFHGTRSVNVPGILRTNLRLPSQLVGVVITGAMFGPGNYYADDWMKSAGYTSLRNSYWSQGSGSVQGREAFMFACDVVLGKPHLAAGPHGYIKYPGDTHCIFGKGGHSGVKHNEWITFDRKPLIRYLAEFTA